ncbi:uncharacterized protein DUF3159 [Actinomycetospora succinea]|uniref:Uncharacterized protein DUF3159 n=1 Tax=Actinomycetospora succinea TaxID=663603 RepID=A0A4V3DBB1_9PSEU|nr:DUF3159 domain-containing protein [Actinomycetospora succinea]TDQ65868.1 uncharacterized protein DUF3159 [Actinomycetospora succinea]
MDPPTGPVDLARADPPTESFTSRGRAEEPADEVDGDLEDEAPEPRTPTLLDQMGGVSGIIASGVPVVVFVVAQAVFGNLVASIAAAVGSAVAVAIWRFVRGDAVQPALSGLLGVAVCAFVAWRTGEAKGFFLLGIWTSLAYGGVFLLSVVVRRPLVGVIWHLVNGEGQDWRRDPRVLRGYDIASLAWVVVFGARFVVQRWLYDSVYADTWLGWVRIAMGVPLAAIAAAVTVWAIRRSRQAAPEEPDPAPRPRGKRSTGRSRA